MNTLKIIIGIVCLGMISAICVEKANLYRLDISDAKWQWIHSKIFDSEPQDIDFVFIGSSRTWCAIKSKQIEAAFPGVKVWNFGRHWSGRDIDYYMVKALLKRHRVKHLMLETIGQEVFTPHGYAKYVISPAEVLNEAKFLMSTISLKDYISFSSNLKERLKHVLGYVSEISLRLYRMGWMSVCKMIHDNREEERGLLTLNDHTGGFYVEDHLLEQNETFYAQFHKFQPFYPVWKGLHIIPSQTYPDYYLRKIGDLTGERSTKLNFIFLADYAAVLPSDHMFAYYSRMGDVYIPTLRNIYKIEYWRDKNHVYQKGAVVFTDEVIALLKKGKEYSEDYRQY